jgi:hypothetical protein
VVAAVFNPSTAAQRILDLTNAERAAVGLPGLTMRADVVAIAQAQSAAMAAASNIWHNEQFLTQATRKALGANMLGENVGMGGNVDQVHVALMNSPGHKANILEPAFSVVGMAVAKSGDGLVYVTQDFVQPNGSAPRPVATPKPVAAAKPKVVRAVAPRAPSVPKSTAAPATTAAPPVTEAPATTTTTVAAQPESSVLAASAAPASAPAPARSESHGFTLLLAFVLVAASATGTVRLRVTRRA